jgi:hypothetical protein
MNKSWLDEQSCPYWVKEMILLSGQAIIQILKERRYKNLWAEFCFGRIGITQHNFSNFVKYLGCDFVSRQIVSDFLVYIIEMHHSSEDKLPISRLSVYRLVECWGLLSLEKVKAGIAFSEHNSIDVNQTISSCFIKKKGVVELKKIRKISQLRVIPFSELALDQMRTHAKQFKEARKKGDFGALGI